jgi:hypothetical protein
MDVREVRLLVAAASVGLMVVALGSAATLAQGSAALKFDKRLQVADGRTFVSDGALAIDDAIAKVKEMSSLTFVPGGVLDKFIQAPFTREFSGSELTSSGPHYTLPDGTRLNARYVDYLRANTPLRRVRLRVSGLRAPVILFLDDRAIGVLMPMAQ